MASRAPSKRAGLAPSAAPSAGALPPDALYEILLRLPAKELCRLRAVCRSWRALTSDQLFIKAHASRYTGPLLATTFVDDESCGVSIVDLSSGDVIKRIHRSERGYRVRRTRLDLVFMDGGHHSLAVTALNPATGATLSSAYNISARASTSSSLINRRYVSVESCAFGKVPSTGEYKAFRFLRVNTRSEIDIPQQLWEVITLDGGGHARWRTKPGPPAPVCSSNKMKSVVIDGVAYFLFDFLNPFCKYLEMAIKPGSIASFNLETEEWMATLDGPKPVSIFYEDRNMILPPFLKE